jgi:hypothetical protein
MRVGKDMRIKQIPDRRYTDTWSNGRGSIEFFTRSDGSRLRYFVAGTGPMRSRICARR